MRVVYRSSTDARSDRQAMTATINAAPWKTRHHRTEKSTVNKKYAGQERPEVYGPGLDIEPGRHTSHLGSGSCCLPTVDHRRERSTELVSFPKQEPTCENCSSSISCRWMATSRTETAILAGHTGAVTIRSGMPSSQKTQRAEASCCSAGLRMI